MILKSTMREYAAPSMEMVVVACEAGFQASTGNVTFGGAIDEGFTELN